MQNRNEIQKIVFEEISKLCESEDQEINEQLNMDLDLGIDSVYKAQLASSLSKIFKVEYVQMQPIVKLHIIREVVDFIDKSVLKK